MNISGVYNFLMIILKMLIFDLLHDQYCEFMELAYLSIDWSNGPKVGYATVKNITNEQGDSRSRMTGSNDCKILLYVILL